MFTGELKNKVDQVWNAFWSGGIADPLEVIEQITYLLFLRRLDSDQTREENQPVRLKTAPVQLYPLGADDRGLAYDDMRRSPKWSTCSTVSRWTTATPRATSTNTCWARSLHIAASAGDFERFRASARGYGRNGQPD